MPFFVSLSSSPSIRTYIVFSLPSLSSFPHHHSSLSSLLPLHPSSFASSLQSGSYKDTTDGNVVSKGKKLTKDEQKSFDEVCTYTSVIVLF